VQEEITGSKTRNRSGGYHCPAMDKTGRTRVPEKPALEGWT
jgi:hypothetical protein